MKRILTECKQHLYNFYEGESCPICELNRIPAKVTPDPKVLNPAERGAGMKFDGGKPRWSLLMGGCTKALAGVAAVLTFGAAKYAAHSWKQVENNKERYRDAMYRHLNAIEGGEVLDPESGLPHWDHVACNALFLSELNKESV
jgi:hypothetical protein